MSSEGWLVGGVAQADDEGEAMARLDRVGCGIITPSRVLTVVYYYESLMLRTSTTRRYAM
jgi:hypothetical protein